MDEQSGESGVGNPFPFEHLPVEIQLNILSYLDLGRNKQNFNSLNLVSKHMRKLAWDESFYKEYNFEVNEEMESLKWWPKPPFVLEKLETVKVHCSGYLWDHLSAVLTDILNKTPKLRCIELRGHGQELTKDFVDIIKGKKDVAFALVNLRVEESFFTELASSLRQVIVFESDCMYLSDNNLRLIADNCGKLRSFSAVIKYDHTTLEYFLDRMKSTLVKVQFEFEYLDSDSDLSIETMRVIGSCVKLQKLSLYAKHIPLAPLKNLKHLKELDITLKSHESDRFDDLSEDLSFFEGGFPFLEKLTLCLNESSHVSDFTFEVMSRSFGKLKCLDLYHFPDITDKGLKFLKRAKGLTHLLLIHFPQITNDGVLNLEMHLESLEHLYIRQCQCVTDHIKRSFKKQNLSCF